MTDEDYPCKIKEQKGKIALNNETIAAGERAQQSLPGDYYVLGNLHALNGDGPQAIAAYEESIQQMKKAAMPRFQFCEGDITPADIEGRIRRITSRTPREQLNESGVTSQRIGL